MKKFLLKLYSGFPDFVKDLIGVCYRLIFGDGITPSSLQKELYFKLQKSEFADSNEIEKIQLEKFIKIVKHISVTVPFYIRFFENEGLKVSDFESLRDLVKLPIITKEMIRSNPEDFFSKDFLEKKSELIKVSTGGSSGTPMVYYFDQKMEAVRRNSWWRWTDFSGVNLLQDRMVYVGGAPSYWLKSPEEFRGEVNFERNRLFLSSAAMSDVVLDRYIEDIVNFKADYIRGYASGVYLIARRLVETGKRITMKAVMTSSDALLDHYRVVIEKAFNCEVFDHYGQNEDILTASECSYDHSMHINEENCIPEVIDGNGSQLIGKEGRFVSTHLENYAMPLVRYVVGDTGVIASHREKCGCGRSLKKIESLDGRNDEILNLPGGRRVGCGSLNQPMKYMVDEIEKCQYVQKREDLLIVRIQPTKKWNNERDCKKFEDYLRNHVGEKVIIKIEIVDDIPSRKNGKYQFIVSELSL